MVDPAKDSRNLQSLFNRVADHYDLMNRFMTLGRDRAWRRFLIAQINLGPRMKVLDVATGTGDLIALAAQREPSITGYGLDFSEAMLSRAKERLRETRIALVHGDATALPFDDGWFNRVVSGFLIRNVVDVERAFAEQYRVVSPGGMVGCIDTTPPDFPVATPLIRLYFRTAIPLLARVFTGDVSAYRYLTDTTEHFKNAEEVSRIMEGVGFVDVAYRRFMFGTIAVHWGRRPELLR